MLAELPASLEEQTTSFVTFAVDVFPSLCADLDISSREIPSERRELFYFAAGMLKLLQIGRGTVAILDLSLDRLESTSRSPDQSVVGGQAGLQMGGRVYTRGSQDFGELRELVSNIESFLRQRELGYIVRARGLGDLAFEILVQRPQINDV